MNPNEIMSQIPPEMIEDVVAGLAGFVIGAFKPALGLTGTAIGLGVLATKVADRLPQNIPNKENMILSLSAGFALGAIAHLALFPSKVPKFKSRPPSGL